MGLMTSLSLPAGVVTSCVNGVTIAMGQKKCPDIAGNSIALLVVEYDSANTFQNQVTDKFINVLWASVAGNTGYSITTANTRTLMGSTSATTIHCNYHAGQWGNRSQHEGADQD